MEILSNTELAARLQISEKMVARMTKTNQIPHIRVSDRIIRYNLIDVLAALHVAHHTDDDAVNTFADALRDRMATKRAEGKNGWEDVDPDELRLKLLRSIADGDPIDVGNYAMMLFSVDADTHHTLSMWLQRVLDEQRIESTLVRTRLLTAVESLVRAWESENGGISDQLNSLVEAYRA